MCEQSSCLQKQISGKPLIQNFLYYAIGFWGVLFFWNQNLDSSLKQMRLPFQFIPVYSNLYPITVSSHSTPKNVFI